MKAAILAVGTELTDGTIANSNAAWISKKLKNKGIVTNTHLVVPDDRPLILQGLRDISRDSNLLFVTGGLGPTSDDFTRELIAEWVGKPLVYDSATWDYISERLTSRGYAVKENQKQQCYFPQGAKILNNRNGTAHGFSLQTEDKNIFVLPGPPNEIAAIWEDFIETWLEEQTKNSDAYITRLWDTLGVGESDIATITEDVFKGTNFLLGYRVHLPYVEVKVSYWKSEETNASAKIQELDAALKEYTITRDGRDIAQALLQKLEGVEKFSVCDEVTGAYLLERVTPLLKKSIKKMTWEFSTNSAFTHLKDFEASLLISQLENNQYELTLKQYDRVEKIQISTPFKTENMLSRRQQYVAELSLIKWYEFLE